MATPDGRSTGTIELVELDYFDWDPEGSPVSIHMRLDAVDGIIHDVTEALKTLSRPAPEIGGLLLGRVEAGDRPTVWIERYRSIPCGYRAGPRFVLDDKDNAGLEKEAAGVLSAGELSVVGLYRSHTREGLQLDEPDFDLIRRYFSDPSDLVLLIKPLSIIKDGPLRMSGRFYAREAESGAQPAGAAFPFEGHATAATQQTERPRRLVPDFTPAPVEPAIAPRGFSRETLPEIAPAPNREKSGGWKLRVLAAVALLLAGGLFWFVLQAWHRQTPNATAATATEPGRPIGLSVEPMGADWHVSWNPKATVLDQARSVQLFVREDDDQNRIDLTPNDLALGSYKYRSAGNDVTFRLEVTDSSGRVSAESFRFLRQTDTATPKVTPKATPRATPKPGREAKAAPRIVEPKPIHRAPPVISEGVRPRIQGTVGIDVRVHVDTRGRVTAATPVKKPRQGLDAYLTASAVQAARLWRFEPARENGKPVPGTQTIHFVFEK